MGDSLNFEQIMAESYPGPGMRGDRLSFVPGDFRLDTALIMTGATTPAVAVVAGVSFIQWAANAANTVLAEVQFVMPGDYAPTVQYPGRAAATADTTAKYDDDFVVRAIMRRQRAAADSAAWSARLTPTWVTPTTAGLDPAAAVSSLTTNATASIPAITADNTADLAGLALVTFDIGARLRAEGKRILPGDLVRFRFGPDAANANAVLHLAGITVRIRKHAGLRTMSERVVT